MIRTIWWCGGDFPQPRSIPFSMRRSMSTLCLLIGGVQSYNYVNNIGLSPFLGGFTALFFVASLLDHELSLLQIVDQPLCGGFVLFEFVCFATLCPKLHQELLFSLTSLKSFIHVLVPTGQNCTYQERLFKWDMGYVPLITLLVCSWP